MTIKINKKTNNKFIFKYDKYNNLYSYVERDSLKNIMSLYVYNYKNNSLVRYDKDNQLRIFTQFDERCKLVQKFEAGESWVKSIPFDDEINNYKNPKIKKQFAVNIKNQVVRFGFQSSVIEGIIKI
jgi:hypothetical protein